LPEGRTLRHAAALMACGLLLVAAAGCGGDGNADPDVDPKQVDAVEPPENGLCRMLTTDDIAEPANATRAVDCTKKHNAETFAVGALPPEFDDAGYDDPELGQFAYQTCSEKFERFLGADESLVMRTIVSWAWFRPSEKAWDKGARWYRCDAVGGGEQSTELVPLPDTAKDLLTGRPADRWMVCVNGPSVAGNVKIPCNRRHTWRAVTTIKVGLDTDKYPGDRLVEVKTKEFCSDSVGAWMNYPVDYDFAYTWFKKAEWEAGNRRSICWARTEQ
jgi:hypothetical protein